MESRLNEELLVWSTSATLATRMRPCKHLLLSLASPRTLSLENMRCTVRNSRNERIHSTSWRVHTIDSPLTNLFLNFSAVNTLNPFGTGGRTAHAWAALLRRMYAPDLVAVAPTSFSEAMSEAMPQFAEAEQQDNQEFLAQLLDKLHEDLNQGASLPPASRSPSTSVYRMVAGGEASEEGGEDAMSSKEAASAAAPAAATATGRRQRKTAPAKAAAVIEPAAVQPADERTLASDAWASFIGLNRSIITDMFQAQEVCRTACAREGCGYVGRRFDACNVLLLALPPVRRVWRVDVVAAAALQALARAGATPATVPVPGAALGTTPLVDYRLMPLLSRHALQLPEVVTSTTLDGSNSSSGGGVCCGGEAATREVTVGDLVAALQASCVRLFVGLGALHPSSASAENAPELPFECVIAQLAPGGLLSQLLLCPDMPLAALCSADIVAYLLPRKRASAGCSILLPIYQRRRLWRRPAGYEPRTDTRLPPLPILPSPAVDTATASGVLARLLQVEAALRDSAAIAGESSSHLQGGGTPSSGAAAQPAVKAVRGEKQAAASAFVPATAAVASASETATLAAARTPAEAPTTGQLPAFQHPVVTSEDCTEEPSAPPVYVAHTSTPSNALPLLLRVSSGESLAVVRDAVMLWARAVWAHRRSRSGVGMLSAAASCSSSCVDELLPAPAAWGGRQPRLCWVAANASSCGICERELCAAAEGLTPPLAADEEHALRACRGCPLPRAILGAGSSEADVNEAASAAVDALHPRWAAPLAFDGGGIRTSPFDDCAHALPPALALDWFDGAEEFDGTDEMQLVPALTAWARLRMARLASLPRVRAAVAAGAFTCLSLPDPQCVLPLTTMPHRLRGMVWRPRSVETGECEGGGCEGVVDEACAVASTGHAATGSHVAQQSRTKAPVALAPSSAPSPSPTPQLARVPTDGVVPSKLTDCLAQYYGSAGSATLAAYECERCEARGNVALAPAVQTRWLVRPPRVLTVLLKRFNCANGEKLETLVRFPVRGLRLDAWVRGGAGGSGGAAAAHVYDLFAVVNHCGSLSAGHYTALAQHPLSGAWYSYNDAEVHAVTRAARAPPAPAAAHKLRAALGSGGASPSTVQEAATVAGADAELPAADDETALSALLVTPAAYCLFYRRRVAM